MRRPLLLLTAALAMTGPAAIATARAPDSPDKELAGRTPGKPESCISQRQIDDSQLYPDGRILYRMRGGPDYLNNAGQGCATNAINPTMVTSTPSTQLCRGDILRVVDATSGMFYGSCGLNDFVPYPKVKTPKR
jgi:hypothetical protein